MNLYEVIFFKSSKKLGLFLWKFCDVKIIDGFGPDGFHHLLKNAQLKQINFKVVLFINMHL